MPEDWDGMEDRVRKQRAKKSGGGEYIHKNGCAVVVLVFAGYGVLAFAQAVALWRVW